uniref:Neprosin PEP catalytic domain-containing protein n=1 Tax=Leersia perrieri TaxID=77586 RepID=A0A0D9VM57_9ORYZ
MRGSSVFSRAILLTYLVLTISGSELKCIHGGENSAQIHIGQQANMTIQAEDGDIYDCVGVNLQPTFQHPILKDHKTQMEPSSFPIGLEMQSPSVSAYSQAQLSTVDCPIGTIPILRNNIDTTMVKHIGLRVSDDVQQLAAGIKYRDEIYGVRASINVYEPKVKKNSKDLSASWIQLNNGPRPGRVGIGAGSMVDPSSSADSYARFHISWDNEELNKTCIDHNCPGFVQVSQNVGLGGRIHPVSIYNGPQYVINVLIFKDPKTKNWWLVYGSNNMPIGYWPSSQFSYIKDKGDFAYFGGYVQGPTGSSDPPQMGSGHFADEGFGKAAFIRNIQVTDENNKLVTPNIRIADPGSSNLNLYTYGGYGINDDGMHIYYGGPGKYKE